MSKKSSKGDDRQVTEQYSVELMRAVKVIEDKYLKELAGIYGCDVLDVPVEIDCLQLVSLSASSQRHELVCTCVFPLSHYFVLKRILISGRYIARYTSRKE